MLFFLQNDQLDLEMRRKNRPGGRKKRSIFVCIAHIAAMWAFTMWAFAM